MPKSVESGVRVLRHDVVMSDEADSVGADGADGQVEVGEVEVGEVEVGEVEVGAVGAVGAVDVGAMAITVAIPEHLRWTDTRRDVEHTLLTLTVRLLPDGHLAVKAYGRPTAGGRSPYVSFPVPDDPAITALVEAAGARAGELWAAHKGLA